MRIYPAIRAQMGDWHYYIVRMKMREIAHDIKLAQDIYEDRTLSEAIQRELGERRVKKDLVGYLARRPDRFFSSIVVAALEGEPHWHPVEMDASVVPAIFSQSKSLNESFGVLSFGDEPKYYALDGQHRVAAIRLLVNDEADLAAPEDFDNDLLSVIVILREEQDMEDGEWMRRYRRLFSSLNRWTKKTDDDTNIIMDEDDLFAILTRRLITDHEFFKAPGKEKDSFKIQTKGKNLRRGVSHFTTLQTLYAINETLLTTRRRINSGWMSNGEDINVQFRPDEDYIDERYMEISKYWDAILEVLPDLHKNPASMRCHDLSSPGIDDPNDHLLFWPIGQELFARVVRSKLDGAFPENGHADVSEMIEVLRPLAGISWALHAAPWRYLLLIPKPPEEDSWNMRNEGRKPALEVAYRLLRWMLEIDPLDGDEVVTLKEDWQELLYPMPAKTRINEMWQEVENTRERIVTDGTSE